MGSRRTGPQNPHRSGLRREPRMFENRAAYQDRRTASGGPPPLTDPGVCWCGEKHHLHWGPLPELDKDDDG